MNGNRKYKVKGLLLSIFIFQFSICPAQSQKKYQAFLEQTKQLSPYEAIYTLMDYQYWHPENADVYYQLGNLCYDLLPTRDPLHHYAELSTLLYQSKLFYGNSLHFTKDAQTTAAIRPRMREIQRQQTACDSIHHSFCRMVDRYNRCQTLFADFLSRYTREKTAHLKLQDKEQRLLLSLQQTADSLDSDIRVYQQALKLQPVPGYEPVFRKEQIVLYRLDGLTHTDFLQNDIALWDYSRWAKNFLREQADVYERLYADIDKEYTRLTTQLARYSQHQPIDGQTDRSLIGRCKRLEYHAPRVDSVQALQETLRNCVAEQNIANSAPPQSVREMVPLLQIAAERREAQQDEALTRMKTTLIALATPLSAQQKPTYTHPVSGEEIRYETYPGEQVYCLLSDDKGYRCAITDEDSAACVLCLNSERILQRTPLRKEHEKPLLFTRIPGHLWALVTDKNVYFIP